MALDGFYDAKDAVAEGRVPMVTPFKKLRYSDALTASPTTVTDARKLLAVVPAYSLVTAIWYRKITNFNAGTNDYMTVGTAADDLVANDIDIATAAATIPIRYEATELPYYTAVDLPLYASYVYSGGAPTTGELEVAVEYIRWIWDEQDI
jgi:hypothetical protein